MTLLRGLGLILIILGILDFALFYIADIDFTGVSWSPYVLGLIGGVLMNIGKGSDKEENQE